MPERPEAPDLAGQEASIVGPAARWARRGLALAVTGTLLAAGLSGPSVQPAEGRPRTQPAEGRPITQPAEGRPITQPAEGRPWPQPAASVSASPAASSSGNPLMVGSAAGSVRTYGSLVGKTLGSPVVNMAATPSGHGYWLMGSDGGIFAFGDAAFYGSTGNVRLTRPVLGMAAIPSGHGYWLVASDGGIFSFGDAAFYGSTGNVRLNQPIVGMAATPSGHGYWLAASDGGIFAFGDAAFYGSAGNSGLTQPLVAMAASPSGRGYRLAAADGGVFAFGDAAFIGSGLNQGRVVGMADAPGGYWLVTDAGNVIAPAIAPPPPPAPAPAPGSSDYTSLFPGKLVRWNPCQAIRYAVNLTAAPSYAMGDLTEALRRLSAATGLTFVYRGTTSYVAFDNRLQNQVWPAAVDAVISWSGPIPGILEGNTVGLGGGSETDTPLGSQMVLGEVDIQATGLHLLRPGFGPGQTHGNLLMHELGHMVGLGHAKGADENMYPDLTPTAPASYGPGDLAGLHSVGATGGCLAARAAHVASTQMAAAHPTPVATLFSCLLGRQLALWIPRA